MEKLISMVDFVLEQSEGIKSDMLGYGEFIDKVVKYAKFLKQSLTLGMFVPCDEDGNVLQEPDRWDDYVKAPESFDGNKEWYDLYAYEQAKERVLFDGFEVSHEEIALGRFKQWLEFNGTVESLVGSRKLTLTPYALKQIGF